jgi:DNA-directed RNA polymerase alpha subunit
MKLHIELNSEEEFIQFASYMQQEKHNLAEVLFNRYKDKYEATAAQLRDLQKKIAESPEDINQYYSMDIMDPFSKFEFNARAFNCIRGGSIPTIGHLLECTENDLLRIPNMGKQSLNHIKEVLAEHGLQLKQRESK